MSTTLTEKTCTPCRGGVAPLTLLEAQRYGAETPDWALVDDARRIERTLRMRNFREARRVVQRGGELAEVEGHRPESRFGWGYATRSLMTKRTNGLHENDLIVAGNVARLGETTT